MLKADGVLGAVRAATSGLERLTGGLREHFRQAEAHRHAVAYVAGLLGAMERKNGLQLAEYGGYDQPRAIQRVLDRSVWDADAVRHHNCADRLQPLLVQTSITTQIAATVGLAVSNMMVGSTTHRPLPRRALIRRYHRIQSFPVYQPATAGVDPLLLARHVITCEPTKLDPLDRFQHWALRPIRPARMELGEVH